MNPSPSPNRKPPTFLIQPHPHPLPIFQLLPAFEPRLATFEREWSPPEPSRPRGFLLGQHCPPSPAGPGSHNLAREL